MMSEMREIRQEGEKYGRKKQKEKDCRGRVKREGGR